jgi:hypothetical protein
MRWDVGGSGLYQEVSPAWHSVKHACIFHENTAGMQEVIKQIPPGGGHGRDTKFQFMTIGMIYLTRTAPGSIHAGDIPRSIAFELT